MSELSHEIIVSCFRENFHPGEVTITIRKRTDVAYGYSVMLMDNFTRKHKEFLTGNTTTINDLQDMCLTAAKLFGYVWSTDKCEGEAI